MKRKSLMPPTYFFAAILVMVGLHFLLPIVKLVPNPYNYIGGVFLLAGIVVNIWCSKLFEGAKTTIKPYEQSSSLVTGGPYRFSRHPMYLGMAVSLAGLAILLGTVTPMLIVPLFIAVADRVFMVVEEKAMEETFGDTCRDYRKRVRRWI